MYRLRPRGPHQLPFSFTKSEIEQLEKLFQETENESFNPNFYQKVTEKLNCAPGRSGKAAIQWTKVQNWFQTKRKAHSSTVTPTPIVSKDLVISLPDTCLSFSAPESSMPKGEEAQDLSELQFEARSSKDGAWYDVATFLTHRVHSSGEPEVRVRFVGFGAEDDEWVNIKKAVRERSIPLERSECFKVNTGDLVLCFQEKKDQAYYFDARVVKVEKKEHDARGCRCLFWVRYDHDQSEEKLNWRKVCCRPVYMP